MRSTFWGMLVIASLSLPGRAISEPDALELLLSARSLDCSFPTGRSGKFEAGEPKLSDDSFSPPFHFDSLDSSKKTARFVGNLGSADVALLMGVGGIGFVESTRAGGLVITTVFAEYAKGSTDFLAVHSRHVPGVPSLIPPFFGQYYGTCRVLE